MKPRRKPLALHDERNAARQGSKARVAERMAGMPPALWNRTRGDGDRQRHGQGPLTAQAVKGDERDPTELAAATAKGNSRWAERDGHPDRLREMGTLAAGQKMGSAGQAPMGGLPGMPTKHVPSGAAGTQSGGGRKGCALQRQAPKNAKGLIPWAPWQLPQQLAERTSPPVLGRLPRE